MEGSLKLLQPVGFTRDIVLGFPLSDFHGVLGQVGLHHNVLFLLGVGADGRHHGCIALLHFDVGAPFELAVEIVDGVRDSESFVEARRQFDGPGFDDAHDRVLRFLVNVDVDVVLDGHDVLPVILGYAWLVPSRSSCTPRSGPPAGTGISTQAVCWPECSS